MDRESIELVRKSYMRVIAQPEFGDAFYDKFIKTNVNIAEKFKETSKIKQRIMVSEGLRLLVDYAASGKCSERLQTLAEKHDSRHLNILPAWYQLYKETLLEALSEYDPDYDDRLKNVWISILDKGIQYFSQQY